MDNKNSIWNADLTAPIGGELQPEEFKSKSTAYLLAIIGPAFGFCGLQRLYMGKIPSGLLYLFTYGFLGIGQLFDLFTLGSSVDGHNLRHQVRSLQARTGGAGHHHSHQQMRSLQPPGAPSHPSASIDSDIMHLSQMTKEQRERAILKFAQKKGGRVTPTEVAVESDLSVDSAKKELEQFCVQGTAEMNVSDSGVLVFVFGGFLSDEEKQNATSII
jgi:hypothetical protein